MQKQARRTETLHRARYDIRITYWRHDDRKDGIKKMNFRLLRIQQSPMRQSTYTVIASGAKQSFTHFLLRHPDQKLSINTRSRTILRRCPPLTQSSLRAERSNPSLTHPAKHLELRQRDCDRGLDNNRNAQCDAGVVPPANRKRLDPSGAEIKTMLLA